MGKLNTVKKPKCEDQLPWFLQHRHTEQQIQLGVWKWIWGYGTLKKNNLQMDFYFIAN